jgi:tetratricopeptide (TPR) repeat protein
MSENPEAGLLSRSPDESQSRQFSAGDPEDSHTAATPQRPSSPAQAVPPLESSSRPTSPARQVLDDEPSPAIQDFHVKSSQVTAPPDDQSSPALTPPRTASPVSQVPPTGPSLVSLADTFPSTVSLTESSQKAQAIPTRKPIFDDIMQSAEDALEKGQYNEALQEFDKLICMRPEDANCRIHRADILLQLGRHADALTEYDEVYQLYPEDGELQEKLSLFHLR